VTAQSTIVGNLTRDPELRFTPSGLAVASLSVAVNRKRGEEEVVSFFDVTAFGTLAENVCELGKGTRVIVVGRLEQRSWEQDGNKRSKVELVADSIGPDVRWATVTVTRAGDGSSSRPAGKPVPADEEPF
jgi:single-strand DNA-binding protein